MRGMLYYSLKNYIDRLHVEFFVNGDPSIYPTQVEYFAKRPILHTAIARPLGPAEWIYERDGPENSKTVVDSENES